ncbi:MAG: MmcQ/YjbR family DNA-binding protein [Candidatus Melainabacteria bacterium]|nr:MmcQ/YjbR family DNA-binding protein [Thiobacillus sp.]MBN9397501.1 MmcQ/YjbR family DNA-binding protein [Candidatus Melainabacteria bacterium]
MITRSELFEFAKNHFHIEPDYPFDKFPKYAVLRHGDNNKWFCLVMNVPRNKLAMDGEDDVDVIDIKCHPEKVENLRSKKGFHPAYHMNKEHWLTVMLDGTVPKKEVFALIGESFDLTK